MARGEHLDFECALGSARAGRADGYEHLFRSLAPRVAGYLLAGGALDPEGNSANAPGRQQGNGQGNAVGKPHGAP